MGTQQLNTIHCAATVTSAEDAARLRGSPDWHRGALGSAPADYEISLLFVEVLLQHTRHVWDRIARWKRGREKEFTARNIHPPCFSQAPCSNEPLYTTCFSYGVAIRISFCTMYLDAALKKAFIDSLYLIGRRANTEEPGF